MQMPLVLLVSKLTSVANGMAGLASIVELKAAKRAMVRRKGYPSESAYFDRKADAQSWARLIETKIDEGKHPVGL